MPTIFIIQLLAFWPVWTWYVATLRDPATDTSVVIALFTAILFCTIKRPARHAADLSFRIPMLILLIYIMTFPWLPPFGRAVLVMIAVSYTLNCWRFGTQSQPWLYGLLLMALPVLSPMYVYLAYPLRLIVGKLAALFLQPFGCPVFFEGIAFNWGGQLIWSDELCSGVRKLWAGGGFTFALAAFYELRLKRTLFLAGWAVIAFITANVLRTMFLVYMYGTFPQLPWWAHKWEGPLMFLIAALAIAALAHVLRKVESAQFEPEKKHFITHHPLSITPRRLQWRFFIVLSLIAALFPLVRFRSAPSDSATAFPGWPADFEGRALRQLELSAREAGFAKDFAGRIARFTDGERDVILRWLERPSPSLRSAWDAFHGLGYQLRFGPIWRDAQGYPWRTFDAVAEQEQWRVRERIYDSDGQSWTDVSSWYWAVLLRTTSSPWWTVTVVEKPSS